MKNRRNIFLFLFFLFFSSKIFAETDDSVTKITIQALKSSFSSFEVSRDVSIIGDIEEKNFESTPDALNETEGVYLQKTNIGAGSPFIRGVTGPHNLILIDGIRLNKSIFRTGPNQYLALIDPAIVEHIELLKGSDSTIFGSDGIGGVINIKTHSVLFTDRFNFKNHVGARFISSSMGYQIFGRSQIFSKKISGLFTASYNNFGDLRSGGGYKNPLSAYNYYSGMAKVAYSPFKRFKIYGMFYHITINDAGRTDKLYKGDFRFYNNALNFSYIKAEKSFTGSNLERIVVGATFQTFYEGVLRYKCLKDENGNIVNLDSCMNIDYDYLSEKREYTDTALTLGGFLDVYTSFLNKKLNIVSGLDFYNDFANSSLEKGKKDDNFEMKKADFGDFSDDSTFQTGGVFTRATYLALLSKSFSTVFSTGARYSFFKAHAPSVKDYGDISYFHDNITFQAGISLLVKNFLNIYFTYSEGFRAPNLMQTTVFGNMGSKFEIPNPDLDAEKSHYFETGLKVQKGSLIFKVLGFYNRINGLISQRSTTYEGKEEMDGAPVYMNDNLGKGVYRGFSYYLYLGFLKNFYLKSHLTYTIGDVIKDDKEDPAPKVPPLYGLTELGWFYRNFKLSFYSIYAGAQTRLSPSDYKDLRICEDPNNLGSLLPEDQCEGTPSFYTLNLRAAYTYKKLSLFLSLENLLDKKYKYHASGVYAPGFTVKLLATLDF